MAIHFPTPRRRSQPRRTHVIDESGQPATNRPSQLQPAATLATRRHAPTDPAMLPAEQRELVADTPLVAKAPRTWEERMADFSALWDSVEEKLEKLAKFVKDKTAFDDNVMVRWSRDIRVKRVGRDRDTDVDLLAVHAADGTAEMRGLQKAIRERILADALAATS